MPGTGDGFSIEDIADRLGVKADTVRMWRHRGVLLEPRWTISSRPAWNWPDVLAWAKETKRAGRLT